MAIETFSTGGGIWLVEVEINEIGDYAVVSSDMPDVISVYHKPEDGNEKYMPEDMYISKPWNEVGMNLGALHSRMLYELQRRGIVDK